MKTILYLDGKKAYVRRNGIATRKVNKSEFSCLLNETDKIIYAVVLNETASKYEKEMQNIGYSVSDKSHYDMFTFMYKFER
jgi:hypothetical protein